MPEKPELKTMKVRLPKSLAERTDRLAAHAGLTGAQMIQAIVTLDLYRTGWLHDEMNPPKETSEPIPSPEPQA